MNIHVSNLSKSLTQEGLKNLFVAHGEVTSVEIAMDAFTDEPRGFGFVDMPLEEEALAAIAKLDQSELEGRLISVREAAPKEVHKGSYKVGSGPVNLYRFKKN